MNRLAILRAVTAAISRENNLDRILSLAADNIIEGDGIDGVLIYLKSQVKNEIELKQYRGISPETASNSTGYKLKTAFRNILPPVHSTKTMPAK